MSSLSRPGRHTSISPRRYSRARAHAPKPAGVVFERTPSRSGTLLSCNAHLNNLQCISMTSIVEHEMDPRNLLAYTLYTHSFLHSIISTLTWCSLLADLREQGKTLRYADHVSTRWLSILWKIPCNSRLSAPSAIWFSLAGLVKSSWKGEQSIGCTISYAERNPSSGQRDSSLHISQSGKT